MTKAPVRDPLAARWSRPGVARADRLAVQSESRPEGVYVDNDLLIALIDRLDSLERLVTGRALPPAVDPAPALAPVEEPRERVDSLLKPLPIGETARPVVRSRRPPPTGSQASDVRRLFDAIGLPQFGYREITAFERVESAATQADMLLRESDGESDFEIVVDDSEFLSELGRTRVIARTERNAQLPVTIAVVSLTEGCGRTMLTANLAAALAQEGRRALAVELDTKNDLTRLFGQERSARFGLGSPELYDARVRGTQRSLACMPFGATTSERQLQLEAAAGRDPQWLEQRLVALAHDGCDALVIDTGGRPNALWRQAVVVADVVLVVTVPRPTVIETVAATEAVLDQCLADAGRPPALHLMNRFDSRRPSDRQALEMLRGKLGARALPFVIQEDAAVTRAGEQGQLVAQGCAGSQVVADLNSVADWILARAALAH